MKIKEKNPSTKELIKVLHKRSFEKKQPLFESLAVRLNRPRRKRYEVNLTRIDKHTKAKDTIIVPGAVLGTGNINKKVDVYAFKFSDSAKAKIEKAGGKCFPIEEIPGHYKKGMKIRIMG